MHEYSPNNLKKNLSNLKKKKIKKRVARENKNMPNALENGSIWESDAALERI
jgi:hypothetical protein